LRIVDTNLVETLLVNVLIILLSRIQTNSSVCIVFVLNWLLTRK